jgi:hypothetical protein
MPTKTQRQNPAGRQASMRDHAIWYDQHRDSTFVNAAGEKPFEFGRPYWSVIEKASGMPSGPVYKAGWEAPWEAPQQYIITSIGRIQSNAAITAFVPRNINTDRFRIDYVQMITDDTEAMRVHFKFATTVANQKNLPMAQWGEPFDSRLLVIVGNPPRSPKIAEAALGGNKWLLGQQMPTRDPRTGQMVVEEDEQLARLIAMGREELWTPEQAQRDAERREREAEANGGTLGAQVAELLAEVQAMKRENARLEAERKGNTAPKKSHKKQAPKDPTPALG